MQWIDEKDLATWAKRTDARVLLIDMVADLIRATISDSNRYRFRFPGGDVGQTRGWDGDLETIEGAGFIPTGNSKWEFGAGAGATKASRDYAKRTQATNPEVMAENVLVLVNLEVWDTPRHMLTTWEEERKAEGNWRDVKYIDAVSLTHWLDDNPAVAAKFAREVLGNAPKEGALSTDEYWDEFSRQFLPALNEKVVIGDRQQFANELVDKLLGPASMTLIGVESSEELVAFAVAAIRTAEVEKRSLLESRTLIVRTESAARELSRKSGLVFIATKEAEPLAGVLCTNCPTLSAATGTFARRQKILLRPSASSMAEGFILMGLDRDQGYELAQRCGRSLTILKRLIPNVAPVQPEWLPHTSMLKPAFLAGGWSSNVEMDCELLRELGGFQSYHDLDKVLMPTLSLSDRPIDKVEDVWQVRAPVDAFYFYGQQLTDTDLNRLRDAIVKVFGYSVQPPSREEKFSFTYTAPDDYSNWLREGLALTLVIISSLHGVAGLHINGKSIQQYVDEIVATLPDWGKNHNSLIRLGNQTALFAEASPNPFLKALEYMLEGAPEEIFKLFSENDSSIFGHSSPHVNVLWALETIAWEPRYLNRAALVLAKLSELDPDPESKLINRPINSLREILLSWSPSTYALQPQRISCLDEILTTCPNIGWQLIVKLLPRHHDSSSPTRHPKIKDLAPKRKEEITFGLVWDFEAAIIERAIKFSGFDEGRIIILVKNLGSFQPECFAMVLEHVDCYLKEFQTTEGCNVWHELRKEAARHNYFDNADWKMKQEQLSLMNEMIERYQPIDPLVIECQFFDDWLPHIGKYQSEGSNLKNIENTRAEVIDNILKRDGVSGVLKLSQMVKIPSLIGQSLSQASIAMEQLEELFIGSIAPDIPAEISFYVSVVGANKFGKLWEKVFFEKLLSYVHDDSRKASLLLGWPQNEETWALVDSLGNHIRKYYWENIQSLPVNGSLEQLLYAIGQFRMNSRDIDVLSLVHFRLKELPTDLILDLLKKGVSQINHAARYMGGMFSYYVSLALTELRRRTDVNEVDVARVEYSYIAVLRFEKQPLTIVGLMIREPNIFIDVLSDVYRKENTELEEIISEEKKARISASYDLLNVFKGVLSQNEKNIELSSLVDWVIQARNEAASKGIIEVCDTYIGYVFAHAQSDQVDTFWPPSVICKIIEQTASSHLERGISIECINKRGVYSKALNEGGAQERQLAEKYQKWAEETYVYPRTSLLLTSISENWLRQAREEDIRSEQEKMRR
ncbi:hypothetical protein [Pantoea sp. App145]|uniref:hypothetical protein n=1 Tax=Pantoea sp. App145 TaxID=3071567 RepID=UPI003A8068B0